MLQVVQIGLGYWGPNLLRNLVVNKRYKVSAVVDLTTERKIKLVGPLSCSRIAEDF
jgi:hypothetical protein